MPLARLKLAGASLILSLDIVLAAGLIPGWGRWYSDDLSYRLQTNALLNGSVALDVDPWRLDWDWAWWDGRAQQVWGLGVPLWRLPFEVCVRGLGYSAFPDRFAFLIALATTTYLLLRTFLDASFFRRPLQFVRRRPATVAAPLLMVLHVPFLTLCRTRFWVYEEAQAYTYLFGLVLAALTVQVVRAPTGRRYLSLGAAAGIGGFVRPTLAAYAVASLGVAALTAVQNWRRAACWTGGVAVCAFGWMLLAAINEDRFGAPMEFGHRINLNSIDRMRFASRFGDPYAEEPLQSASRELFGAIFLAGNNFNGDEWYASNFFPGQSKTIRWRELYFSTYDLATLVIIILAWAWALARFATNRARVWMAPRFLPPLALSMWSAIAAILLGVFYLRSPFIASRYLLDFGPAFAACTAVAPYALTDFIPRQWQRSAWFGALVIGAAATWSCYSALSSDVLLEETRRFPRAAAVTKSTLHQVQEMSQKPSDTPQVLPAAYSIGMSHPALSGFNGEGWNALNGRTRSAVAFFLPESDAVELELSGDPKDLRQIDRVLRARIGCQDLELASVQETLGGRRLTFHWPQTARRPTGVQVLFVGMVTPEELDRNYSRYRILNLRPKILE